MWQKAKPLAPLILIITTATILRFIAILKYGDFWDDEMFNFIYSQKTWPKGIVYWLWETNPPLHLLILKIWFYIFPTTEFFARFPSLVAGVISVYIIYQFGRDIFNKYTAYIAALYLAIHPYHIFWSATSRVYIFLMLLSLCSTWIFYKTFFVNDTKKYRYIMPIINLLLIFSHLSAILFLAGQFITLIIFKNKYAISCWIKINAVPFMMGFLWTASSFIIKLNNDLGGAWFFNIQHSVKTFVEPILNLIAGQLQLHTGILLTTFMAICLFIAVKKTLRTKENSLLILLPISITPIIFSLVIGVWHIKFFASALPIIVVILTHAILSVFNTKHAMFIISTICIIGLTCLWQTLPLTNWKNVTNYYNQCSSDDMAFIYNNYILKPQIDRYLPDEISKTAITSVPYNDLSWDDVIVKKNYIITDQNNIKNEEWYYKNKIYNYKKIILLQGEYGYMKNLSSILEDQGWQITKQPERASVNGNYYLYCYENNK